MQQAKLSEADKMTVAEFLAFTAARPGGERWELVEGFAILSPSATKWHQDIAGNIYFHLMSHRLAHDLAWVPRIGVNTVVPISPRSLPQPDVYVESA